MTFDWYWHHFHWCWRRETLALSYIGFTTFQIYLVDNITSSRIWFPESVHLSNFEIVNFFLTWFSNCVLLVGEWRVKTNRHNLFNQFKLHDVYGWFHWLEMLPLSNDSGFQFLEIFYEIKKNSIVNSTCLLFW